MRLVARPYLCAALLATAAAAGPAASRAQAPARRAPPPSRWAAAAATDSAAWQRVLAHVVAALSGSLVRASADSAAQPWTVTVPPNEPQGPLLARQLRTLLRARRPEPGDSVVRALELRPLRVTGDTGLVVVRVEEERRCPGTQASTGFNWVETVVLVRHPTGRSWGAARSRGGAHGDQPPCPRPPR